MRAYTVLQSANTYLLTDLLFRFLLKYLSAAIKARQNHEHFTKDKVNRPLDVKTPRKDFIDYIFRDKRGDGVSRGELYGNSHILILADSETTATVLSGATWFLLQHPKAVARLQAEVRMHFASIAVITVATALQLPYLRAVLDEPLRIYPPVSKRCTPSYTRRNCYRRSRRANWYTRQHPTTDHLQVSRKFYETQGMGSRTLVAEEYANNRRETLQPFSVGPRNCIGRNIAYSEMSPDTC